MNGQKFVYKFVSYPEILNMDPMTVGRVEGECEALSLSELSSSSSKDVENGGKEKPPQPGAKTCAHSASFNTSAQKALLISTFLCT